MARNTLGRTKATLRIDALEDRQLLAPAVFDPNLAVRTVVTRLVQPTSMAFLDENAFFVLEKRTGRVQHVVDGEIAGTALDLNVNYSSERGLLGIALHPEFHNDEPFVYLYWTASTTGADSDDLAKVPLLGNRVDRFRWNGTKLLYDGPMIALRAYQEDPNQPLRGNHDGGVIRFGPDGKLYIIVGDVGRRGMTQNNLAGPFPDDQFGGPEPDDAHFTGVIIRLNADGTTPNDNPFYHVGAGMPGQVGANVQKMFAFGVRNSFGMAFDPISGELWTQENGDDSFDEINRVDPGFNGGWIQIMDATDARSPAHNETIAKNYGHLPLHFQQNVGQFDARVDFVAHTGGMTTFLTPTAAVFAIQNSEFRIQNSESSDGRDVNPMSSGAAVYMEIVGAHPAGRATGMNQLPGTVNYFSGNDPSQWHTNVAVFGRVVYQDVYPGIDLAYYGNNGALEYDFIVSPGADPNVIGLNFAGADDVEVDPQGNLVLHTAAGDVVQQKPLTYQQQGGSRQEIASRYVVNGTGVRFEVGAYDPTQPFVIDPLVLGYSTFLGGAGSGDDLGEAIALDAAGNAYVTGRTDSAIFPTTPGAFDTTYPGGGSAFVAKLNSTGTSLIYGTYLGPAEFGLGIAVDSGGNAYVTGYTGSPGFPTTPGAFDTSYNGNEDAFVAKLSADGSTLMYGTYLGGTHLDHGEAIAVDATGNAYVTGESKSINFPTTAGAFDLTPNGGALSDGFVSKLSADGTSLVYSTYLGGSHEDFGSSIALDSAGNAYMTGYTQSTDFPTTPGSFDPSDNGNPDGFVTKLNAAGTGLVYSTYMGGFAFDVCDAIALDAAGNAYVTGRTDSTDFPTLPTSYDNSIGGGADAFAAKLNAAGTSLVYGTFLGGAGFDRGHGIAVDAAGNAYVTGSSSSADYPTTLGAFDTSYNTNTDAFMTKVNAAGTNLVYSTYLGGSNDDSGLGIAADAGGNAYVTGTTGSTNFPTTPGAFKRRNRGARDAFVSKFAEV